MGGHTCDGESHRTPQPAVERPLVVALVGNPNTGKTTLFNALTGFRRRVGNYPGVTMDLARGAVRRSDCQIELVDLPGTYSLTPVSPDEAVVANVLSRPPGAPGAPDAILAIVDASNLQRNLYLVTQLLELGRPVIIALNMVDVARSRGIEVDTVRLSERLGVPVIPVTATLPESLEPLRSALPCGRLAPRTQPSPPIHECAAASDPAAIIRARYDWIRRVLDGTVRRPSRPVATWTARVDRVLTHKLGGAVFLLAVLYVIFQTIFYWSGPLMEGIEWLFALAGAGVTALVPAGFVQSLLVDGLIGGVGGVVTFLPQIMLLFTFIAILEDCGYMARAAFMMDRLMRMLGLSGRGFIPLLSGFACAVPAIMGARAIAERRERFVTILLIPFMSCSARLPIYLVLIAALVPDIRFVGGVVRVQALTMLAMYLVGIATAIPVAWLLRKTAFAGASTGFVLELPAYKLPRWRTVWQRVSFSARDFLVRAGTIILLVNLVVWALAYFPRSPATRQRVEAQAARDSWTAPQVEAQLAHAYLHDSYLGRMGHGIEPVLRPLGWDWRIGVSVLASFPAREVVIATLGTLFNLGERDGESADQLRTAIQTATWTDTSRKLFTLPVGLSLMVFFALCAQCSSTLVTMGREMGSVFWPILSFCGMTTLAYLAAWGTSAATAAILAAMSG